MKKSLPFKLYAGLALAVIIVLLVGLFTIIALQKQEEQTSMVNKSVGIIQSLRDIRYNVSQMRAARRIYWITGNETALNNYYAGKSVVPNRLDDIKKEVTGNPVLNSGLLQLDKEILSLFTFWENKGKISNDFNKAKITEITLEEEKMISRIFQLFETIKSKESQELADRESSLTKSNTLTKQVVIAGISLLMLVVLVLVNAVIVTLKSRIRAGYKLQNNLAEMEKANVIASENNWVLQGVHTINTIYNLLQAPITLVVILLIQ
jgi:CHASE3 domain sensor protein